jgi:hypothetical protein
LKSKLQKLEGLTYNELKLNMGKVIKDIPFKIKHSFILNAVAVNRKT